MEKTLDKKKEEIVIASVVYLSAAIPFIGFFVPLIMWLLNRDKSVFLVFHSLQNLVYQSFFILIYILGMILYVFSFLLTMIVAIATTAGNPDAQPGPLFFICFFLPFGVMFLMFFFYFIYLIYAIIGFIVILIKKDFKYIIIGKMLENYLLKEETPSESMDNSC